MLLCSFNALIRRALLYFLAIIPACLWMTGVIAAEEDISASEKEYRIHAAFIYNFLKFVQWPQTHSPVPAANICITGDRNFASYLRNLQNPAVNVLSLETTDDMLSCHILFISNAEAQQTDSIISHMGHHAILSISEASNFANNGGIIEIVRIDKRIGLFSSGKLNLRINLKTAASTGLTIDARLLQIAAEVIK